MKEGLFITQPSFADTRENGNGLNKIGQAHTLNSVFIMDLHILLGTYSSRTIDLTGLHLLPNIYGLPHIFI